MELDEKRFKELMHRQRDLIWRVCSSYRLSAAWTTEDAFHEVLCDLWRGFGTFDRRSSESTWVYRVSVNTMNSLARKMGNRAESERPASWIVGPSQCDAGEANKPTAPPLAKISSAWSFSPPPCWGNNRHKTDSTSTA